MQRERVTDDIYVFTSDRYAQVTATLILTAMGSVVIGTLTYPEETRQIRRFAQERLNNPVRFVINTHYHADHTVGTCFFEDALVIAHHRCRELLDDCGHRSIEVTRLSDAEMDSVALVLPHITFAESLTLHLGDKTLKLWHTPGHTPDSIVCLVEEDQILIGSDTLMPIPFFVDGNYETLLATLRGFQNTVYEAIIPGYGDIILRGEVKEKIQTDIDYLVKLDQVVQEALASASPEKALNHIDIESCGISRVLLNGMVERLHRQNVLHLARQRQRLGS